MVEFPDSNDCREGTYYINLNSMKKIIVVMMFALVMGVSTPNLSQAATVVTMDQVTLKQQLITMMTELVSLLRQKMASQSGTVEVVSTDTVTAAEFAAGLKAKLVEFEATNPEFPTKEKITYDLDDAASVAKMSATDKYVLELVKALAPTEKVRDSVKQFRVYFDEDDTSDASVTAIDDENNEFVYEVNYKAVADLEYFVPIIVHEYTHILTLVNDQHVSIREDENIEETCKNYMIIEDEGCFTDASYMNVFFQKFWKNSGDYIGKDREEDETEPYYETRKDKFVTDYATKNPVEDIAESFMYYTAKDPVPSTNVMGEKVNFFLNYPELVEYRSKVRSEISSWTKS